MAAWDAGLPAILKRLGFSETSPDNTLRFNSSYGPAKLRKRTSSNIRIISGNLPPITDAQKTTLETFYAANQALIWTSDLRDSGGTENYRFTAPPVFNQIKCDSWDVKLSLEVMP